MDRIFFVCGVPSFYKLPGLKHEDTLKVFVYISLKITSSIMSLFHLQYV